MDNAYLTVLLVVHILGAIAGIGPTFAFGILGAMAGKSGREGALALMEASHAIEMKVTTPVALVTQPLTGVLLIFETGRNQGFFSHTWLWVSILAYIIILALSYGVSTPNLRKMMAMLKEGKQDSPEFAAIVGVENKLGPLFGILTVLIIVFMIWKPGDGI